MIKVSGNIICKNEIKNIEKCIDSIRPYCDEIVVIDTGSTDGTLEFLKECQGISLYEKQWNDDFADMRNYALNKSSGEYVLTIDADMVLHKLECDFTKDYYLCSIGMESELGERVYFPTVMLFKNIVKYKGKRHATIEQDILEKKLEKGRADIIFYHPKMSKEEVTEKMNKNLDIHLWQLKNEPDNIAVSYHLLRTYYWLGDYESAIKYGLMALEKPINKEHKALSCIIIYLSYCGLNSQREGIHYLSKSIEILPNQIMARWLMYNFFKNEIQTMSGFKEQTLNEIKYFSEKKISDLPADYFFTKKQLKEME